MLVFKIDPPVKVSPADDANPAAETPPANVDVPVPVNETVPVAVRFATLKAPEINASPWTERVLAGDVVPIPTKPAV